MLRIAVSAIVLLAVVLWLDPLAVASEVQGFSLPWLALGLAISVVQMMLCAWRWRLTAGLIGVPLRFRYALGEYYLAQFINQVLPGGVLGDAGRALRHAHQTPAAKGSAWRAVIIERASGQMAVALLTVLALVSSPLWHKTLGASGYLLLASALLVAGAGFWSALRFTALICQRWPKVARWLRWVTPLKLDIQRGLLQRHIWSWQLAASLLVVFSYALVMLCAARAIGVSLPASQLLALAPALLLAMLVPFTVAGWGVREGTAASVWVWVGLAPSQGVAVSLAYGLMVLLAALPGLVVAFKRRGQAAPDNSGAVQVKVKKGVIAKSETPCRGAQGCFQGIDGRQHKPRATGTNQQRCHQQMQAVNTACVDKLRHSDATAFDQDAPIAQAGQRFNYRLGRKLPLGIDVKPLAADMSGRSGHVDARTDQMQGGGTGVTHQGKVFRHSPARVQYHPQRVPATDMPNGELWVVRAGSAGADNHRITHGPQTVQMHQAFMAIDVVGMPAFGGDAPIHTLPKLGNYPGRWGHQRHPAVEEFAGVRHYRAGAVPSTIRTGCQRPLGNVSAVTQRQQPLPRSGHIHWLLMSRYPLIFSRHSASSQHKSPHHAAQPKPLQVPPIPFAIYSLCHK